MPQEFFLQSSTARLPSERGVEAPYKLQAKLMERWIENKERVDARASSVDLEIEWAKRFSAAFRSLYDSPKRSRLLEIFLRGMQDEDMDALQDELEAAIAELH